MSSPDPSNARETCRWRKAIIMVAIGLVSTAGRVGPPARIAFADEVAESATGGGDAPADASSEDAPDASRVPREFRGDVEPIVDSSTDGVLRTARDHARRREWTRAFDAYAELCEALAGGASRRIDRPAKPAGGVGAAPNLPAPQPMASMDGSEVDPDFTLADVLTSADGIVFRPLETAILDELSGLDAEVRAAYVRTYEPAAASALRELDRLGPDTRVRRLRSVALRHALAPSGRRAWEELALRQLDAGRPAAAAAAFESRLRLPFDGEDTPRRNILAQLAAAQLLAGNRSRASAALAELAEQYGDDVVLVRGAGVLGRDVGQDPLFVELASRAFRRSPELDSGRDAWLSPDGSFDGRAARIDGPPSALGSHVAWTFPPQRSAKTALPPPSVVGADGLVFVRGAENAPDAIVALEVSTGKIRWIGNESVGTLVRGFVAGDPSLMLFRFEEDGGGAPAGSTSGGAEAGSAGEAIVVGIDRRAMGVYTGGGYRFSPNALIAYGARNGKLGWSLEGSPRGSGLGQLTFLGPPVPTEAGLVAPARSRSSFCLVGVTPRGRFLWVRRLHETALRSRPVSVVPRPGLASRGSVVVASFGHGLISCADATSGEIRWQTRYRSRVRGGHIRGTRASSRPSIVGDRVLVAAPDSDYLVALDLESGDLLWDRPLPERTPFPLGVVGDVFLALGDRLLAIAVDDGEDRWSSPPLDEERGRLRGMPCFTEGEVLLPFANGEIAAFSATDGSETRAIRVVEKRLPDSGAWALVPLGGRVILSTPGAVHALRPQDESWTRVADSQRSDRSKEALLLRAERRYPEALEIYYELRKKLRTPKLREDVEREIVATAREAAKLGGDPTPLAELIGEHSDLLEAGTRRSLVLLEASLLLEGETEALPANAARVIDALGELSRSRRTRATSPEGFDVDCAVYASELLRDFIRRWPELAGSFDSANRALAENSGRADASTRSLSRRALTSAHLPAGAEVVALLVRAAARAGAWEDAAARLEFLAESYPNLSGEVAGKVKEFRARAPRREHAESVEFFPSDERYRPRFWIDKEEGFLAPETPRSRGVRALFAVCGTRMRVYGPGGTVEFERELPGYPDVSEVKLKLAAQFEEPASVFVGDDYLVLFTAAGLYGFRFAAPAETSTAPDWSTLRLRWVHNYSHALLRFSSNSYTWGGLHLSTSSNAFPDAVDLDTHPLVWLTDARLRQLDGRSGKLRWEISLGGTPLGGIRRRGAVAEVLTGSPYTLHRVQLAESANGRPEAVSTVCNQTGQRAVAGAGGLFGVFEGRGLACIETATGAELWRKSTSVGRPLFVQGGVVWISEVDGKLRLRSLRTGRVTRTIDLGGTVSVIDGVRSNGSSEVTLVCLGGPATPSARRTAAVAGASLRLIHIAEDEVRWNETIEPGAVIYGGVPVRERDSGRFLLTFNTGEGEGKWYTRVVRVDPKADAEPHWKNIVELEIKSKGHQLPPRLSAQRGGLALGNADGFGRLEPATAERAPEDVDESNEAEADRSNEPSG